MKLNRRSSIRDVHYQALRIGLSPTASYYKDVVSCPIKASQGQTLTLEMSLVNVDNGTPALKLVLLDEQNDRSAEGTIELLKLETSRCVEVFNDQVTLLKFSINETEAPEVTEE